MKEGKRREIKIERDQKRKAEWGRGRQRERERANKRWRVWERRWRVRKGRASYGERERGTRERKKNIDMNQTSQDMVPWECEAIERKQIDQKENN